MSDLSERDRNLWCAVLAQAMADATPDTIPTTRAAKAATLRDRQEARAWLTGNGKDFRHACSLADMDPDWIAENAARRFAEHDRQHAHLDVTLDKPMTKRTQCDAPSPKDRAATTPIVKAPCRPRAKTYTFNGQSMKLAHWAELLGVSYHTLCGRLKRDMSPEEVFTPMLHPLGNARFAQSYTFNGMTMNLTDWSRHLGISTAALRNRLKTGQPLDQVFTSQRLPTGGAGTRAKRLAGQGGGRELRPKALGPAGDHKNRTDRNRILENEEMSS